MKATLAFTLGLLVGLATITAGHWTETTDPQVVVNCPHGTQPYLWGTMQDALGSESKIYKCAMSAEVNGGNQSLHA